ncbi:hypothetical protein EYC84_010514 [Monilinia fructicola]|uniref:Uncharacterized protein n=1 Tax=Monilinia fructicola TaxID=38448 RepID=A0A5M9J3I0_MONFR|nr:hypothetical protein EYC84_010514 [Monilinia fructicola]
MTPRDQYLHIKEDSRTRGVKLDFIIMKEDAQQLPLTSIIQRQYPLTSGHSTLVITDKLPPKFHMDISDQ